MASAGGHWTKKAGVMVDGKFQLLNELVFVPKGKSEEYAVGWKVGKELALQGKDEGSMPENYQLYLDNVSYVGSSNFILGFYKAQDEVGKKPEADAELKKVWDDGTQFGNMMSKLGITTEDIDNIQYATPFRQAVSALGHTQKAMFLDATKQAVIKQTEADNKTFEAAKEHIIASANFSAISGLNAAEVSHGVSAWIGKDATAGLKEKAINLFNEQYAFKMKELGKVAATKLANTSPKVVVNVNAEVKGAYLKKYPHYEKTMSKVFSYPGGAGTMNRFKFIDTQTDAGGGTWKLVNGAWASPKTAFQIKVTKAEEVYYKMIMKTKTQPMLEGM